ncbi:insulin-like receptor [Phymastichus coffea]|uniref:insulin-like receptor n=1 Tax=Phymastichus coffea TaxID=108790 RepID=UPI00273A82DD|nr:insulin-like receptor [Phymastichus coffea]XP_058788862.1 insulin-like receptor [Phymastichus coffea]
MTCGCSSSFLDDDVVFCCERLRAADDDDDDDGGGGGDDDDDDDDNDDDDNDCQAVDHCQRMPTRGVHSCRRWQPQREVSRCAASVVRWILPMATVMIMATFIPACAAAGASTASLKGANATTVSLPKDGVCQSIDIRNQVSEFSKLEGCRVIEGFVQILLIDQANASSYNDLVFPDLVEITGYLLLFRVQGLTKIGNIFPNLTVIRGHQLFVNYALVAFEMMSLQEIGLHSLTDIMRGSVRFEKNPLLCYADTIDWDLIATNGKGENVISGNKPMNECPKCDKSCPKRPTVKDTALCWDKQFCQKVCPSECGDRACLPNGVCCDSSCLGGCTGETEWDCRVCREVVVNKTRCVSTCPPGTYKFLNRRCITQQECHTMRKPREMANNVNPYPYKPFNNECSIDCPPGYEEYKINNQWSCKKCEGPCMKECGGMTVDSIASAQKLRGCTLIKGNLEIAIREGQNIVRELEDNLSGIEVITGYLKIFRSFPIISLNFLKNLTEIRGDELEMKDYTLVVLDNQNLQELWNWTTKPRLKIGSRKDPKVSFHYNPKLCLQTIEALRERTGLKPFTDIEVSSTSNGDKVACNVTEIKTAIRTISSKAAIIIWEPFVHHDMRTLLGYVIYSKEAPYQNVSMYESRDACGGDGWKVDDVPASEDNGNMARQNTTKDQLYKTYTQNMILMMLKPFTQYVYYVRTYTISTERSGAQSKLNYFTTLPGQPSAVRSLTIYSNASDTLVISWLEPSEPNSNLTHYKIIGKLEHYDLVYLRQRNYCEEPLRLLEPKPIAEIAAEEKLRAEKELQASKEPEPGACTCPKRETVPSEKEAYSSIAFENALHNQVYIKRSNNVRRRRDTTTDSFMLEVVRMKRELNSYQQEKGMINQSKKLVSSIAKDRDPMRQQVDEATPDGAYQMFERRVPATENNFVMRNLRHYGKYNIMVMACREKTANPSEPECSPESMKSMQTIRMDNADDIDSETFIVKTQSGNDSTTTVTLYWQEPPLPNGAIVTYHIEYRRVETASLKIFPVCITGDQFREQGNSHTLTNLLPGNYSVRVRATSFAGNGGYTVLKTFLIPESNLSMPPWKVTVIVFVCLLFFVFAIVCGGYLFKEQFLRNVPSVRLIATVNPEYVSTTYQADEWELPRKRIQLGRELGNGSFGMVYEGTIRDLIEDERGIRCAVKTVTENATDRQRVEFLNEASVMKAFNTHHVVKLLGVVSQGQPTLVIMELMVNGDLKTYLRSHRPDQCENFAREPPTLKRILQMAIEIADGMAYLTAKKFVHRDLAARNCMVADDLTVKIGDFGMTRDIYETDYYRKGTKGLLPVRWMAPESLKDGVFSCSSDVWSYGVVLWEMVTLASQPYQGLSNDQVLKYVIEGGVMERPGNCPDAMYSLMRLTWNKWAPLRPTFIDIVGMLLPEVNAEAFERVSFYHSTQGAEARKYNPASAPTTAQTLALPPSDNALELVTLQGVREEDVEGEEKAPLRQDFPEFSSFEPVTNGSSGHFGMESFTDSTTKTPKALTFIDLNSSKTPLRAGFDDFDGVSAGSLASSKDALNLPFTEDSVQSVKNSPFAHQKSSSKSNVSQSSAGRSSLSPQSPSITAVNSGNRPSSSLISSTRSDPEYENRSPEALDQQLQSRDITGLHVSFPSMDAIDSDEPSPTATTTTPPPRSSDTESSVKYQVKPSPTSDQQQPTTPLNNGYIGGANT